LKSEWKEAEGDKLDGTGAFILALALVSLMYGFSILPSVRGFALLFVSLLAGAGFVRRQGRIDHPLLDLSLFRDNPVFVFSNLAALINYSATFAITFLLSLYLQYTRQLTPQQAGLMLVAQPIMQAIISPFAGRLSDRLEPRWLASIGMGLSVVGLFMLTNLSAGTSYAFIILSLVLLGMGFGLFSSPNTNAVMGAVGKRVYGVASSILGTMRLLGQMLSMGIALLVFSIFIGHQPIALAPQGIFVHVMHLIFVIFAFLCLGGIFASLARGKVHKQTIAE
jgi:MFS family permease